MRSLNSYRRHLSPAQSAAIVMKHTEMLEHPGRPKQDKNVPRGTIKSAKEVAKEAGVSKRTVDRTKKAMDLEPDKVDAIIEGKVTPTEIIKEHRKTSLICPCIRMSY